MNITSEPNTNMTELEQIEASIHTLELNIKRKRTLVKAYFENKPMGYRRKATILLDQINIYNSALSHLKQDKSRIEGEAEEEKLPPEQRSFMDQPIKADVTKRALTDTRTAYPGSVFNDHK